MVPDAHANAITECYGDVERLIHYFTHKAVRKYGLPYSEVLSNAHVGYCQAFKTYDGSTKFETWVGDNVKHRIQDYVRTKFTPKALTQIEANLDEKIAPDRPMFNVFEWAVGLSKDALEMVKLVVLDTPMDIKVTLVQLGLDSGGNWRYAIRDFLRDSGWDESRIAKAFKEVKSHL